MHTKRKAWIVLLLLAACIRIFSLFPLAVEKYYSNGIYVVIGRILRLLFGWIPFSLGDFFYGFIVILLVVKFARFTRQLFKKSKAPGLWKNALQWLVFYSLLVYTVFNLAWGLNYNRMGMAYQLKLDMQPYSTADLSSVMETLLQRLDSNAEKSVAARDHYLKKSALFGESCRAYEKAKPTYPQLDFHHASVKPSLFSYLGDWLGFTGYYNPFSGEAQVNTTVPVFVRPFTTCHEMGHQLGYARENEANFAAFLTAKSSADPAFRYSVYFEMYTYGIRELYRRDSVMAKQVHERCPLQIKADVRTLRAFYAAYENPLEPYIAKLYGGYLKANAQPGGIQTYSEVMAFLVAYSKKYGKEKL